ncbi:MAG: 50S ribosomal protein L21, partial [Brevundimonas sp.]
VIRVTEVAGGGKSSKWDGEVDLTPKALLDARARNLTHVITALQGADAAAAFQNAPTAQVSAPAVEAAPAPPEAAPALDGVQPDVTAAPEAAEPKAKAAPKKAAAPKAKKTEE